MAGRKPASAKRSRAPDWTSSHQSGACEHSPVVGDLVVIPGRGAEVLRPAGWTGACVGSPSSQSALNLILALHVFGNVRHMRCKTSRQTSPLRGGTRGESRTILTRAPRGRGTPGPDIRRPSKRHIAP